jgi:Leucine-rich repeat (LRR) protein
LIAHGVTDYESASLTTLDLVNTNGCYSITSSIKLLKNLSTLTIGNDTVNDIKFIISDDDILGLTNLTSLDIGQSTFISDRGIKELTNLTYLVSSFLISDRGIKELTKLSNLNLESSVNITDEGLMRLEKNIHTLDINHNWNISSECLKNLTNITRLNISYNHKISENSMKNLTNLTSLNIEGNEYITDRVMKEFVNLTHLDLTRNRLITNSSLRQLKILVCRH